MKQELKSVIELVEKNTNVRIPEKLCKLELYKFNTQDSFKNFLINERIIPFFILKLLFEYCLKSACVMGYEKVTYVSESEYEDGIEEQAPLGPSIIKGKFSGEEVFNTILERLGIITIQVGKTVPVYNATYVNAAGTQPRRDMSWFASCEGRVIIVLDSIMIFTENLVYVDEKLKDNVSRLIKYNEKNFDEFLEKADKTFVNHEIYTEWLLKWFPGMIHIRSLGYSRSQ